MTWLHPCPFGKWSLKVICPARKSAVLVLDYSTGLFLSSAKEQLNFWEILYLAYFLLLCLKDHRRCRNLFIATLSVAKRKTEKKKTAKVGSNCDDLVSFNSSPHSSYISYIYYSLFHLFSFVVVSVFQSFDAHGKEEKLSPGVYNLVRIKLWHQLFSTWITLFTG